MISAVKDSDVTLSDVDTTLGHLTDILHTSKRSLRPKVWAKVDELLDKRLELMGVRFDTTLSDADFAQLFNGIYEGDDGA